MKKERRWLIEAIQAQLLPDFVRRGFESLPLPKSHFGSTDRELIVSLPFGRLRRTGVRGFDQVEIQLAPYGRAAFRINVGVIPPEGVSNAVVNKDAHWPAEELMVGWWLGETFTLYSCPFFLRWFAVRRSWWSKRKATESDYKALVDRVIGLLPEVERALSYGKRGRHLRYVKVKLPVKMRSNP